MRPPGDSRTLPCSTYFSFLFTPREIGVVSGTWFPRLYSPQKKRKVKTRELSLMSHVSHYRILFRVYLFRGLASPQSVVFSDCRDLWIMDRWILFLYRNPLKRKKNAKCLGRTVLIALSSCLIFFFIEARKPKRPEQPRKNIPGRRDKTERNY